MIEGFVGSYDDSETSGIYTFQFDNMKKTFIKAELMQKQKNVKYLSYKENSLVAACMLEKPGILMMQKDREIKIENEANVACYVTQDENDIYSANYHDGTVAHYIKNKDNLQLSALYEIEKGAGTHQVIVSQKDLMIPCRLLDSIYVIDRKDMKLKTTLHFSKKSGPRHGVLNTLQDRLYVLFEDSCEVLELDVNDAYNVIRKVTLHQDQNQGAAAIKMSKDERFLYTTLRETNEICVIDINDFKLIQRIDCGGLHPRDLAISTDQQFIFVPNRLSNSLSAFLRDSESGQLQLCDTIDKIPEGVCIAIK